MSSPKQSCPKRPSAKTTWSKYVQYQNNPVRKDQVPKQPGPNRSSTKTIQSEKTKCQNNPVQKEQVPKQPGPNKSSTKTTRFKKAQRQNNLFQKGPMPKQPGSKRPSAKTTRFKKVQNQEGPDQKVLGFQIKEPGAMSSGLRAVIVLIVSTWVSSSHVNDQSNQCDAIIREAYKYAYGHAQVALCKDMMHVTHGGSMNNVCRLIRKFLTKHQQIHCLHHCKHILESSPRPNFPAVILNNIRPSCDSPSMACDGAARYRTYNGTCNNMRNADWGSSGRLQNRVLPNRYEDGTSVPRETGHGGMTLPNPRTISNTVHRAGNQMLEEKAFSYMMMIFGQFLAHDIVLTEMFTRDDGDPLDCCQNDSANSECFPIHIPSGDSFFQDMCMPLARSKAQIDCNGIRQQFNSQTSYLDLSVLYGSDEEEALSLREMSGGLLKSNGEKLTQDYDGATCSLAGDFDINNNYCGRSGDIRLHEQPALASMHTLWLNEHNRVARELAHINPAWGDEWLYQETRRILIAEWQHIVFSEYLPLVLGPYAMRKYGLTVDRCSYRDTYNPDVDATVINAFASAAMRYGHSLVHKNISMMDAAHVETMPPEKLDDHFFKVALYHSNENDGFAYHHILRWTMDIKCPRMDGFLETSIQDNLYKDENEDSFDLASINIHRGRDHGNARYSEYRKWCGLPVPRHFGPGHGGLVDHDRSMARRLSEVYRCTDDIDLFTGLVTERRSRKSLLGPLAQCLIGSQFKRLKDGDRFFYERGDPVHEDDSCSRDIDDHGIQDR
ncbi:myeloperoxidase-like [Mya arenaria]|uniref:myeloperoxidase-like n=1 Tax=Mya arenaria TaxID=6604 RepID=UPI0022E5E633|nr:myeloperoxidase-like [Mya arenaria]